MSQEKDRITPQTPPDPAFGQESKSPTPKISAIVAPWTSSEWLTDLKSWFQLFLLHMHAYTSLHNIYLPAKKFILCQIFLQNIYILNFSMNLSGARIYQVIKERLMSVTNLPSRLRYTLYTCKISQQGFLFSFLHRLHRPCFHLQAD